MRRFIAALTLTALSLTFGPHSGRPAAASAFDLRAVQYCAWNTPGLLSADVSWSSDGSGAQQWLDVSDSNNGWVAGTYASMAVPPNSSAQTLTFLSPNKTYYVEVSQVMADGSWQFSPTRVLRTSSCFFVPAKAALPYGAYYGQNPADGARIVSALSTTGVTTGATGTAATGASGASTSSSSSSSASSGSSNANCTVSTSSGSLVQAPLNAGTSAVGQAGGC